MVFMMFTPLHTANQQALLNKSHTTYAPTIAFLYLELNSILSHNFEMRFYWWIPIVMFSFKMVSAIHSYMLSLLTNLVRIMS